MLGNGPGVGKCPAPWAVQNLQMPHPRDWQGGQMPRSSPGGGGGWAQGELTDALINFTAEFSFSARIPNLDSSFLP